MRSLERIWSAILGIGCFALVLSACLDSPKQKPLLVENHFIEQGVGDDVCENDFPVKDVQPETLRQYVDPILRPGEIITYSLGFAAFQEFLNNPSAVTLYQKSENLITYRKSEYREGYIVFERRTPNFASHESVSGAPRIGAWPVYSEFLEFVNDFGNFDKILMEQGFEAEVLGVYIFTHPDSRNTVAGDNPPPGSNIPKMSIWIRTDAGDYFLEHHAFLDGNSADTDFSNRSIFHDLTGYSRKYGLNDGDR